jgi:hypothetical protein
MGFDGPGNSGGRSRDPKRRDERFFHGSDGRLCSEKGLYFASCSHVRRNSKTHSNPSSTKADVQLVENDGVEGIGKTSLVPVHVNYIAKLSFR